MTQADKQEDFDVYSFFGSTVRESLDEMERQTFRGDFTVVLDGVWTDPPGADYREVTALAAELASAKKVTADAVKQDVELRYIHLFVRKPDGTEIFTLEKWGALPTLARGALRWRALRAITAITDASLGTLDLPELETDAGKPGS